MGKELAVTCMNGDNEMSKFMIDADAPINAEACSNRSYNMVMPPNTLHCRNFDHGPLMVQSMSAFMWAAFNGQVDVVRYFINRGVHVDEIFKKTLFDQGYNTAFTWAVKASKVDVIKLLISSGANADQKFDKNGMTALMVATITNQIEIVKALTDAGVNL